MNIPNLKDPYEIATLVLAKSASLDPRMAPNPDESIEKTESRIEAWAGVISRGLYPRLHECIAAVEEHYTTSSFPIMPNAIIEYLKRTPRDSSPERLMDWMLDHADKYPRSRQIAALSGLEQPFWDDLDRESARVEFLRWVHENELELKLRLVGHLEERRAGAENELRAAYDPYAESRKPELEGLG